MNLPEAVALIRDAVPAEGGTWVNFGAGKGLFSRALATLIGPAGSVLSIDRDERALSALRKIAVETGGAPITPIRGDFLDLDSIRELEGIRLDGALFANSLHYARDSGPLLRGTAKLLRADGRVVIVEYDRDAPNPWVPYPLRPERLRSVATQAGFPRMNVVGTRGSAFGGRMYCAVLQPPLG